MSYYSDIALCMTKDVYNLFKKYLETNNEVSKRFIKEFIKWKPVIGNEDILFVFKKIDLSKEDLKREILETLFLSIFASLHISDGESYLYVKIGETVGDVFVDGSYFDNSFNLHIEIDIVYN